MWPRYTVPVLSVKTAALIEDSGRLPGCTELACDGGTPKLFLPPVLKSSISLLRMMPVEGEMTLLPKLQIHQVNGGALQIVLFNLGLSHLLQVDSGRNRDCIAFTVQHRNMSCSFVDTVILKLFEH